jgi:hypothetical protein
MRRYTVAAALLAFAQAGCFHALGAPEDVPGHPLIADRQCAAAPVSGTGWQTVHASYGGFTLRLPPSAERAHVQRNGLAIGENWRGTDALEVSYRIYNRPLGPMVAAADTVEQIVCSESASGRMMHIRVFYSPDAYVPGQYVVGYTALSPSRTLVLTATAFDPSQVEELLTIVRSVHFNH